MEKFDLIVIGGGTAGLTAVVHAAEARARVALVEKTRLAEAAYLRGVEVWPSLLINSGRPRGPQGWEEWKVELREIHDAQCRRWEKTLQDLGVKLFTGAGRLVAQDRVCVETEGETTMLAAPAVILATGSRERVRPAIPFDAERILRPDDALSFSKLPGSLLVVGGQAPAVELAHGFNHLGVRVFLSGQEARVLDGQDPDLVDQAEAVLKKEKVKLLMRKEIQSILKTETEIRVTLAGGVQFSVEAIIFTGQPEGMAKDLVAGEAGPRIGGHGDLLVNERMETSAPGLFGAGSVTGHAPSLLRSEEEGRVAAANALGKNRTLHMERVPLIVKSGPGLAAVGCFYRDAHHFGFRAVEGCGSSHGAAPPLLDGKPETRCKVVVDRETGRIIGGQAFGEGAAEMIAVVQLAMRKGLKVRDLAQGPSVAESRLKVLEEAARNAYRSLVLKR